MFSMRNMFDFRVLHCNKHFLINNIHETKKEEEIANILLKKLKIKSQ